MGSYTAYAMIAWTVTSFTVVPWDYAPHMLYLHKLRPHMLWLCEFICHTCCTHKDRDLTHCGYMRVLKFKCLQVRLSNVRTYSYKGLACKKLCELIRLTGAAMITWFPCKHYKSTRRNQFSCWENILYIFSIVQSPSSEKAKYNIRRTQVLTNLLLQSIT